MDNNNNNMDKNESLLKKCRPPQGMYQSMFFWGVNFHKLVILFLRK